MPLTLEQLNQADPASALGLLDGLYEHSPWIAAAALAERPFRSLEHLKHSLVQVLAAASAPAQLELIRAHPELAGKAMVARSLTAESANEQSRAGLTQCTLEEFTRIQQLNADYNARFGFPFILAVRGPRGQGLGKQEIIATFARRLQHHPDFEREEALRNIHRIAEIRLNDKFGVEPTLGNAVWDWQEALAEYPQLAGSRVLYETIRRMLSAQVYDVIDSTRAAVEAVRAGDDLYAESNPAGRWTLTLNQERNRLTFRPATGDSLKLPLVAPTTAADGTIRYAAPAGTTPYQIQLLPSLTADSVTGQPFDYIVQVSLSGTTYRGRGLSLRPLLRLHNSWVLTSLNGEPVRQGGGGPGSNRPRIEINLSDGLVVGSTGCNRLSAPLQADPNFLRLGPIVTTRMACLGDTTNLEHRFLQALSGTLAHTVANNTLTLSRSGRPILTFRKVD